MTTKNVVFIDSRVAGYETLIASLSADTEWYLLNAEEDGVAQMSSILANYSALDSIQVISHGSTGTLYLGSTILNSTSLYSYESQLQEIGSSLTATGDILLYGCNVGAGETGQSFVTAFVELTGADVAASDNITGQGGDWNLEVGIGSIEATGQSFNNYQDSLLTLQARNYSLVTSLDAAILSNAAYSSGSVLQQSLQNCGWTPLVSQHSDYVTLDAGGGLAASATCFGSSLNAYAFAAKRTVGDTTQYTITFRGTDNLTDWMNNLGDSGFSEYYKSLRKLVEEALFQAASEKESGGKVEILVTGHSLGGAAAQAMLLDILVDKETDAWSEISPLPTPLDVGDRLGSSLGSGLAFDGVSWDTHLGSYENANSLLSSIVCFTFGAPSISADDFNAFPNLTQSESDFIRNVVFQYEHEDSDLFRGGDPVSSIGLDDYGFVLDVDLSESLHDRYENLFSLPSMHSMLGYQESISRLITSSPLLKDGVDLPYLSTIVTDSADSNIYLATTSINAGGGNDVLIAQSSDITLDGGSGLDAYVIADYGLYVSITGSANEKIDRLYLNLLGQVSAFVDNEDLIVEITCPSGYSTSRIEGWYSSSSNYQLAGIAIIRSNIDTNWDIQNFSFESLDIPLFDIGTGRSDQVIGSLSSDSMNGYAGDDVINGRDGDDTIYGGDGNDDANGGVGADGLFGDAGNDNLSGGDGSDTLYGGDGNDYLEAGSGQDLLCGESGDDVIFAGNTDTVYGGQGSDQILFREAGSVILSEMDGNGTDEIIATNGSIQANSTRFVTSGNDLLVAIFDREGDNFSVITIQDFLSSPVEYLTVGLDINGQNLRYNLGIAWNLASSGDSIAGGAIIQSESNWPWLFGTDAADTLNGSDTINDYIRGYGGADSITGMGGNDILYGMDGNDTLEGEDANDLIYGGGGNDSINAGQGTDWVNGGSGTDTLNIDWSTYSSESGVFSIQKADLSWVSFDTYGGNLNAFSIDDVLDAFTGSPLQFKYAEVYHSSSSSDIASVTWKEVEKVNIKSSGDYNFIVYQGGTEYVGGPSSYTDTFFGDFSSWSEGVSWTNGATSGSYSDNTVSTLGANHQVKVSGMERLLLLTGSGNDTIIQQVQYTNDEFRLGGGDDSLSINASSGNDKVTGGSGTDTLNIDWSTYSSESGVFSIQKADLSWVSFDTYGNLNAFSIDDVLDAFAGSPLQFKYAEVYHSSSNSDFASTTWKEIEKVNIKSSGSYNFIVYQGGTEYVGGPSSYTDTFFGDFSSWSEGVSWTNGATSGSYSDNTVSTLGANHQVKVSGMERLLLLTGSGNDTIIQQVQYTNDEFRTGSGNDTISSASGNDTLDGGSGADSLTGGDGSDVFILTYSNQDQITDFSVAEGDKIDLSKVLTSLVGYTTGNPFDASQGFFTLDQYAGGTRILVDKDGSAGNVYLPTSVAYLVGVNPDTLSSTFNVEGFTPSIKNHQPTASNQSITIVEDSTRVFALTDFGFADVDLGDSLQSVTITTLETAGTLKLNGVDVSLNQAISATDITAGKLTYTPAANATGNAYTSFSFKVSDGVVLSTSAYTVAIDVNAVNDAPTLSTFALPVISGTEDSLITVSFANLQTQGNESDIDGSVNAFVVKAISTGTLKIGTSSSTATAWTAGTNDVIDSTHLAYWTPAANANGTLNAFTVVAKDNSGSVSTTAVQAKVSVTNANDLPAGAVSITGTATQGQLLTASHTLADADGLGTIAYQWKANGVAITGATAATYTLKQAEVGKTITVTASYTDGQGTLESKTSAATASVANVNDLPTGTVTIAGTATQGQILTASHTLADADGLGTVAYQWKANGVAITGATAATYTLKQTEVGKAITVTASYTDGQGTLESKTSSATTSVANINDAPTGTVTIAGTATQGQILTASHTLADADGLGTIAYQWKANGVAITGATAATYTLKQAEVGKTITVTANYTDGQGTLESKTSSATQPILNGVITGTTGNDTLMGTYAANTMAGLAGNDTYYINHTSDVINEAAGAGTDLAYSYLSNYTLTTNVENGRIIVTTGNLAGNTGNNILYASSGNNTLNGSTGTDTANYTYGIISGTAGVTASLLTNTVTGASGSDTLIAIENLTGSVNADSLTGNASANILEGGAGTDTLTGGLGNDTYVVRLTSAGNREDSIIETSTLATEIDTLKLTGTSTNTSVVTHSLSSTLANLENLDASATGSSLLNLSGNAVANSLTGNAAKNLLNGGNGNDTLAGGLGNDTLTGGSNNDQFLFNTTLGSTNVDTITDFTLGTDKIVLDDDIFTTLGIIGTTTGAALNAATFYKGAGVTAVHASTDRILYDTTSGKLYYDADGLSTTAAVQIALIGTSTHANLTASDFLVAA